MTWENDITYNPLLLVWAQSQAEVSEKVHKELEKVLPGL